LGLLALSDVTRREDLIRLKLVAVRRGLWFRVLDAVERAIVDLAIRVVERVKSSQLKGVLTSIASKIVGALKARAFRERAMAVGRILAERIARIAERLGVKDARRWVEEVGFTMYLGVSWLNSSPIFRRPIA